MMAATYCVCRLYTDSSLTLLLWPQRDTHTHTHTHTWMNRVSRRNIMVKQPKDGLRPPFGKINFHTSEGLCVCVCVCVCVRVLYCADISLCLIFPPTLRGTALTSDRCGAVCVCVCVCVCECIIEVMHLLRINVQERGCPGSGTLSHTHCTWHVHTETPIQHTHIRTCGYTSAESFPPSSLSAAVESLRWSHSALQLGTSVKLCLSKEDGDRLDM